jgi:hypothetical protein
MKLNVVELGKQHFYEIVVPNRFAKHSPKPEKLIGKTLKFSYTGDLGDILVDEKMELIDGYCSYLIAQHVGTEYIKIKMVKVKNNE